MNYVCANDLFLFRCYCLVAIAGVAGVSKRWKSLEFMCDVGEYEKVFHFLYFLYRILPWCFRRSIWWCKLMYVCRISSLFSSSLKHRSSFFSFMINNSIFWAHKNGFWCMTFSHIWHANKCRWMDSLFVVRCPLFAVRCSTVQGLRGEKKTNFKWKKLW